MTYDTAQVDVESIRQRIRLGAAWLDVQQPDWRDRVTVPDLDLSNVCRCVLGQVFTPDSKEAYEAGDERAQRVNDFERTVEDLEDGYWNGFSWIVATPFTVLPEEQLREYGDSPDEWTYNGRTFISNQRAKALGFDYTGDDGWDYSILTTEWRSFLTGHWA